MIIWLASYPRSGNTLLRMMLKTVFERSTYSKYDDLNEIGADPKVAAEVGHEFLGDTWPNAYDRMRRAEELFLVKTHDAPEDAGKAVYVVRDGRSACRSFFHYLHSFSKLDRAFSLHDVVMGSTPLGSWGDHLSLWDPINRPDTLVLKYEDLIADPAGQVQRLADFTGLRPLHDWRNDFDRLHTLSPQFFRIGTRNDPATALAGDDLDLFWVLHGHWMLRMGYPPTPADPPAEASAADPSGTGLARAIARAAYLERDISTAAARLDEARRVVREQAEHAATRVSASRDLTAQLAEARSQLDRLSADHAGQTEQVAELTRQLEQDRATLNATIGDLQGHQHHFIQLSLEAQESARTLARHRDSEADLGRRLEQLQWRLALAKAPPVNRRGWPFAAPDARPIPDTLPGGKPWPKILVVTPSFNHGRYIEQTILSVVNQRYPNLEYVVVDGGSTDETGSVLDRYADRIHHVIREPDNGQSDAVNKGFARSTGELLTWLNSDDMFEPGALLAMAMAFHTSAADMVAGLCTLHTDGVVAGRHLTGCASGPLPLADLLDLDRCWLRGQFFYQPEVMFTRDLWLRAGGTLDETLHYSMDYDLWLRFAEQRATLHVIGRPIALYRVHDEQKTFRMSAYSPELTHVRDRFCRRTKRPSPPDRPPNQAVPRTHLRVVFFNDLGNVGGAGIAHHRLATAVAAAGHVAVPIAIRPTLTRCGLSNDSILRVIADREPDLIFVGNIHSAALDPAIVGLIADRWPTVQVLHDLYSLTGRCAYTGDCRKFVTGCDDTCPTPGEYPALDPSLIAAAWATKNSYLTGDHPPVLAAVSRWTADVARRRFQIEAEQPPQRLPLSLCKPTTVEIRYGLPVDQFYARDRSTCRDALGLPQDRFIVLFSSSTLADKRKGLDHLIAALQAVDVPDLLAVYIGSSNVDLNDAGFESRSMGYVDDHRLLAMLYSAADVFVGPSLVETFGQVFIEAAACGIPSIGYSTAGGVADAVVDAVSGYLAPDQSPAELAGLIDRLYKDPGHRRDLAAWGRTWVENEFSFRSSYHRIFSGLLAAIDGDRFGLPPGVWFGPDPTAPEPITWLDPLRPVLTPTELELLDARRRIDTIQSEKDQAAARSLQEITTLRHDRDQSIAAAQVQVAELENQRDSLRAERDHRDATIRQMTQTRAWKVASAVYPIYHDVVHLGPIRRLLGPTAPKPPQSVDADAKPDRTDP